MSKYQWHPVYTGDNASDQYKELIMMLEQGYKIVSAAPDQYRINYILEIPPETLNIDRSKDE